MFGRSRVGIIAAGVLLVVASIGTTVPSARPHADTARADQAQTTSRSRTIEQPGDIAEQASRTLPRSSVPGPGVHAAATAADQKQLRVLHWNIYGVTGNQGTHEVVDRLIDNVEGLWADGLPIQVLSINETCLEQTEYAREQLKSRLGIDAVDMHFAETGTDRYHRCYGSGDETGVGLIVLGADSVIERFEHVFPIEDGKRAAACMLASYQSTLGRDVWACSAHLATRSEGDAELQALTLVTELEEKSSRNIPIVLAGDLNRKPDHFDWIYASAQDGSGNYLEVDWPENRPTYEYPDATRKLDYIFGDQRHLVPTAAALLDGGRCWSGFRDCSDHYLLFGTLAFRESGGSGGPAPTRLAYRGPTDAPYHQPFTASAKLTHSPKPGEDPTAPLADAQVSFTLGSGGGSQTCAGTTNSVGVASCQLTATQRPGRTTLTADYAGDGYAPSSITVPFTITRAPTTTSYTGPKRVANGMPVRLSGKLREESGSPIEGRKLRLTLGSGEDQQTCTGTTNSSGTAGCTLESVDQPLNATATVPVHVRFAGDPYYLSSSTSATVLLEYYTGRAYGLTGTIGLPLVPLVEVEPTPDTGPVRTASAFESTTSCVAEVNAAGLLTADALCPKVTTELAPGTSTSTTSVDRARIGLPGLPVIEVRGATAKSTSTCGSDGSATGSTDLELYVGSRQVTVPADPNSEIDLPGVARLVINEQTPVAGADHGLTVNAVHLTTTGGVADIVIASATSDVHNCAS